MRAENSPDVGVKEKIETTTFPVVTKSSCKIEQSTLCHRWMVASLIPL
jgi:hypothetical protein